jgi:hypothetical protein
MLNLLPQCDTKIRSVINALGRWSAFWSLMGAIACLMSDEAMAGPIRVFIMAGQSNMVGGAPDPAPATLTPQTDVLYQYRLAATTEGQSNNWESLRTLAVLCKESATVRN